MGFDKRENSFANFARCELRIEALGEEVSGDPLTTTTADEARRYADRGWKRRMDAAEAMREMERQEAEPAPWQAEAGTEQEPINPQDACGLPPVVQWYGSDERCTIERGEWSGAAGDYEDVELTDLRICGISKARA